MSRTKWWHNTTVGSTIARPQPQRQTSTFKLSQRFHGCISLFLISSLHSPERCCHALYSRPRSPNASERGREGERAVEEKALLSQSETKDALWEDKPYCSMLFFLQTKQYMLILYKSKVACQALITMALWVHSWIELKHQYVVFTFFL